MKSIRPLTLAKTFYVLFVLGWLFAIMFHVRQVIVIERECSFELGAATEFARRLIVVDNMCPNLKPNGLGEYSKDKRDKINDLLDSLAHFSKTDYSGYICFQIILPKNEDKSILNDLPKGDNDGMYVWEKGRKYDRFERYDDYLSGGELGEETVLYDLVMSGKKRLIQYKHLDDRYTNVVVIVPIANSSGENLLVLEMTDTRFHHSYVWYDTFKFVGGVFVVIAGIFLFYNEKKDARYGYISYSL